MLAVWVEKIRLGVVWWGDVKPYWWVGKRCVPDSNR